MFTKPVFVSVSITLLALIPVYFLASQNYQLDMNNLPLIGLSLFVTILVASFWTSFSSQGGANTSGFDSQRESGEVKWFNASKGFGFITRDSGDDVFVHFRSIRGSGHRVLRDGQRVEFEVSEGDKGLQADDVAELS